MTNPTAAVAFTRMNPTMSSRSNAPIVAPIRAGAPLGSAVGAGSPDAMTAGRDAAITPTPPPSGEGPFKPLPFAVATTVAVAAPPAVTWVTAPETAAAIAATGSGTADGSGGGSSAGRKSLGSLDVSGISRGETSARTK